MSATDELRRLLDERGVEWKGYKPNPWTDTTAWDIDVSDPRYGVEAGFEEFDDGATLLRFWNATPEQVIAATLDAGTCHDSNNRFNAWQCSECGATLLLMFDDYDEPTYSVDGVADVPRYCPNCGRKVVDE